MNDKLPLVVLTGFLGSGKTTLLRRWRRNRFEESPWFFHIDVGIGKEIPIAAAKWEFRGRGGRNRQGIKRKTIALAANPASRLSRMSNGCI